MHSIEPYYRWRDYYIASEDVRSPFHGLHNSEFEFTDHIYDFVLHPQWDNIGSPTLFLKVIFADYEQGYAFIELIGEWNDLLYNDVMILKRDIIEPMMKEGINKFVLIGENVLNFHYSDEEYYAEWLDDIGDGWIIGLNFREHVIQEIEQAQIDYYINLGGRFQNINWRTFSPARLFEHVAELVMKRLQV